MASLSGTRSLDVETRVQDYLNDKLQTAADLENLDSLLQNLQNQQQLLQKQLDEAITVLADAENASDNHQAGVRQKAEEFADHQEDIDRRLLIITQSETSDDAVKRFESTMGKLRRLDIATGYMELLQEVDKLSLQAHASLGKSHRAALGPYHRLRSLVTAARDAQPAAEGAAPHLVDHLERQTSSLFKSLKKSFEDALQRTLNDMGWPSKDLELSDSVLARWTEQVEALLDLQEPDIDAKTTEISDLTSPPDPMVLLPLEIMLKPLELRFRFHFFGNKATNRLDKPEYFLSHVLDLLETHNAFMLDYLQPILDERSRAVDSDETSYTDATSAFITALLPMVSAKSLSLLSQISSKPQLLSHFIHELMSFDSTLRDSWAYAPLRHFSYWKGMTWYMLTTHGYFSTWLRVEKEFALSRYKDIRDASESNEQDFDSTGPGTTVPTKGAIRVNDLLETVTDRYRSLSSFSQKLRFLIDIQLAIFDDYHQHLHASFQSYQVNSTLAGKLVQGTGSKDDSKTDVSGLNGLKSLSKVFGSAEYLERKMSDWSDDIFFLELWDELQDRARGNTGVSGSVGRGLNTKEVASRTSNSIAAGTRDEDDGQDSEGALFDETASSYRRLRVLAEDEIGIAVKNNVRGALKAYTRASLWASLSANSSDPSQLSPTASLDGTLQVLSAQLGYLASNLATAPLRRITRQVGLTIQKEIWDNVLMRHSFSTAGVAQLQRDVTAVQDVVDSSIKAMGEAQRGMKKLSEALILLGLPIKVSHNAAAQKEDDPGWDFEEDSGNEEELAKLEDSGEERVWSLWEAEKRIFRSNESARDVLVEMGLETLTESDARAILERRVEIGS